MDAKMMHAKILNFVHHLWERVAHASPLELVLWGIGLLLLLGFIAAVFEWIAGDRSFGYRPPAKLPPPDADSWPSNADRRGQAQFDQNAINQRETQRRAAGLPPMGGGSTWNTQSTGGDWTH